jgi:hypothetical protein
VEECVVSCDHASCHQAAVDAWWDSQYFFDLFAYKQLAVATTNILRLSRDKQQ